MVRWMGFLWVLKEKEKEEEEGIESLFGLWRRKRKNLEEAAMEGKIGRWFERLALSPRGIGVYHLCRVYLPSYWKNKTYLGIGPIPSMSRWILDPKFMTWIGVWATSILNEQ